MAAQVQIIFVGEGRAQLAPPASRVVISETMPTIQLITDGAQLKEVEVRHKS